MVQKEDGSSDEYHSSDEEDSKSKTASHVAKPVKKNAAGKKRRPSTRSTPAKKKKDSDSDSEESSESSGSSSCSDSDASSSSSSDDSEKPRARSVKAKTSRKKKKKTHPADNEIGLSAAMQVGVDPNTGKPSGRSVNAKTSNKTKKTKRNSSDYNIDLEAAMKVSDSPITGTEHGRIVKPPASCRTEKKIDSCIGEIDLAAALQVNNDSVTDKPRGPNNLHHIPRKPKKKKDSSDDEIDIADKTTGAKGLANKKLGARRDSTKSASASRKKDSDSKGMKKKAVTVTEVAEKLDANDSNVLIPANLKRIQKRQAAEDRRRWAAAKGKATPKKTKKKRAPGQSTSNRRKQALGKKSKHSAKEPILESRKEGPIEFDDIFVKSKKADPTKPFQCKKKAGPTRLFLSRQKLVELSQVPEFRSCVEGFFVRMKKDGKYTLCQVRGIKRGNYYQLRNSKLVSHFYLLALLDEEPKYYTINYMSDSPPKSRKEFDSYVQRTEFTGEKLVRREQINKLLWRSYPYPDTEQLMIDKTHRAVMTQEYRDKPHVYNWYEKTLVARWELRFAETGLREALKDEERHGPILFWEEEVFLAKLELEEYEKMIKRFGTRAVKDSSVLLDAARDKSREREYQENVLRQRAKEIMGGNYMSRYARKRNLANDSSDDDQQEEPEKERKDIDNCEEEYEI